MPRMPQKLFLITGPSGVGKTTLVEWAVSKFVGLTSLQKAVTRVLRQAEVFGHEVVPMEVGQFHTRVKEGVIVAPYMKYGEWYGLFAKSQELLQPEGGRVAISGLDVLERTPAITVGDAFEAPVSIRKVVPKLVVVLLKAKMEILMSRLLAKKIPQAQKKVRLETVGEEYAHGFPNNVKGYDHVISMETNLEIAGNQLLEIIKKELAKPRADGHES